MTVSDWQFRMFFSDLFGGNLSCCWVDDEDVPVHGDQQDGEGGKEDTGGLGAPH